MQGVRAGNFLISEPRGPFAYTAVDPVTRRKVRFIETIVPSINSGESLQVSLIPSDRYYALLGPAQAATELPLWIQAGTSNVTYGNWDATQKQFYVRMGAGAGDAFIASTAQGSRMVYPTGPYGVAPSYAPKNADATLCSVQFTARFNANADYTVYGIGANNAATLNQFDLNTEHFFQVLRNAANWELGTCDGTTISQTAVAGADGSWHEFEVRWNATNVRLYVDGVLMITKTSNMPARPIKPVCASNGATNTIDVVDYLVSWSIE